MYRIGIIKESLIDSDVLNELKDNLYKLKVEMVSGDEYPVWNIYEYHILEESKLIELLDKLIIVLKDTWYIHAFNENVLYVAFRGKWFRVSRTKDNTWDNMLLYGREEAKVDSYYLENITLTI